MTHPNPTLPAPGWYADPREPAGKRWWDGMAWTAHVAPAPEPVLAPSTAIAAAPAIAPYRPFADRDARFPLDTTPAAPTWRRDPTPNPAATRAAIAAALLIVFLAANVALGIPVAVPFVAVGVAIVFGIIGIVKSRETLSGLKRSIAAVVVGTVGLVVTAFTVLGAVALISIDYGDEYESSLVELSNSVDPVIAAQSADCGQPGAPRDGDAIPCTLSLADGSRLAVVLTITSDRGSYVAEIPS